MCLEKRAGAHLHTCAWVSFCKQCAYTYMLRRGDRALISRVSRVVRDDTRESEEFSVVCCGRVRIVISVLASGRGVHSTDSIVSRMLSLWPVFAHPHLFGSLALKAVIVANIFGGNLAFEFCVCQGGGEMAQVSK